MGLNITDPEVEQLAAEVAQLASETKTEAIRQALLERRARLRARGRYRGGRKNLSEYLERQVWPFVPAAELGRVITREEENRIVGYS